MLPRHFWRLQSVLRLLALLFVGLCAGMLLMASFGQQLEVWLHADKLFVQHVISFLCLHGVALIWISLFLREHHTTWAEGFGLDRGAIPSVLLGGVTIILALPVAMIFIGGLVTFLLKLLGMEIDPQPTITMIRSHLEPWKTAVLAVAAVVLAPIVEESIFRGILYPAFKQRGHQWIGLWVTAFIFGAIHFNLAAFFPLTFLALVFTWLYERTGNLLASMAAHCVFNAINFILLIRPPDWKWLEKLMTQ